MQQRKGSYLGLVMWNAWNAPAERKRHCNEFPMKEEIEIARISPGEIRSEKVLNWSTGHGKTSIPTRSWKVSNTVTNAAVTLLHCLSSFRHIQASNHWLNSLTYWQMFAKSRDVTRCETTHIAELDEAGCNDRSPADGFFDAASLVWWTSISLSTLVTRHIARRQKAEKVSPHAASEAADNERDRNVILTLAKELIFHPRLFVCLSVC